jgi:hypothetical protein
MTSTTTTIAAVASSLGIETARLDRGVQGRLAAILRELNWQQKHTMKGNVWFGERPQREPGE